jgi:hypothetical protein
VRCGDYYYDLKGGRELIRLAEQLHTKRDSSISLAALTGPTAVAKLRRRLRSLGMTKVCSFRLARCYRSRTTRRNGGSAVNGVLGNCALKRSFLAQASRDSRQRARSHAAPGRIGIAINGNGLKCCEYLLVQAQLVQAQRNEASFSRWERLRRGIRPGVRSR